MPGALPTGMTTCCCPFGLFVLNITTAAVIRTIINIIATNISIVHIMSVLVRIRRLSLLSKDPTKDPAIGGLAATAVGSILPYAEPECSKHLRILVLQL
jgi:hypothetical protein